MNDKKRVSLTEVLSDFRSGLDDKGLMEKYGLSFKQLEEVYRKLIESGSLTQAEVDSRKGLPEDVLELEGESVQEPARVRASGDLTADGGPPVPALHMSAGSLPPQPENWHKKAALGIIGGLIVAVLSGILPVLRPADTWTALLPLLSILAVFLQIWGCYYLVKGKGYHGAWSILGGVCFPAMLVLLLLPNKYGEPRVSGVLIAVLAVLAMFAVVSILGIIMAISIPYYVAFKRSSCDRMAAQDVQKLSVAFERLANDLVDKNLLFDDDAISRVVNSNALQHMVGPYYGFRGSNRNCKVLIRINRHQDKWVIEGAAVNGSRPEGPTSRYVYRELIGTGKDLPAAVEKEVADAEDGKSTDWNSYPFTPPNQAEICYKGSIIEEQGPGDKSFTLRIPDSVPCDKLEWK